ncbi:MAG: HAMP domain-containing histidine kinase [Proteobacteria bacterium]|nr:HAMP domain-containing histidine kinase [Pseudomonadota bacterium]
MKFKIKHKIFFYSAFFFIIVFIALLYMRQLLLSDFHDFVEGSLEDKIYWVTNYLEQRYQDEKDLNKIAEDTARLALIVGLEVKIFDDRDVFITDTHNAFNKASPNIKKRLSSFYKQLKQTENHEFLAYPLFSQGEEIGTIEIRKIKDARTGIFVTRTNQFFIIATFIALLGALLFNYLISRSILSPLGLLYNATKNLAEGKRKIKIAMSTKDELGELIDSFNKMSNKLEEMEEVRKVSIAKFAHELRTPITIIQGEIEGALDGVITLSQERLLSLLEEIERLKKMVFSLEDLYKIQKKMKHIKKEEVDLRKLFQNLEKFFNNKFSEGTDIKFFIEVPENLKVFTDEELLKQMLYNLISNSINATEKGYIKVRAENRDNKLFIEIEDTGKGIKQEDIPYIFDPFYSNTDGMGVGLSIVKEIVELFNGSISVQSEIGVGTKITILLPH